MTADERINALLERAGCPVMVVKSDTPPTPERHMAYLIDRLEVALENALNERDFAADTVRSITALDVVPVVHARWIEIRMPGGRVAIKCSVCKNYDKPSKVRGNYCWNCGAKMDGDADAD